MDKAKNNFPERKDRFKTVVFIVARNWAWRLPVLLILPNSEKYHIGYNTLLTFMKGQL